MSNKAYYFGDAEGLARLMRKMYFGVETEVPVYEEQEVTTTKLLSVANLGDFFEVTTNTPSTDPWTFADTATTEVRMAGIKKGLTQYRLTLTAKRALTGVAVDAEYYFSQMYGTLSIRVANSAVLSKSYENANSQRQNYWTGALSAGDTIQLSGNHIISSTSATPLVSVYVSCDGISTTTTEQVQVGTETKELARKVIRAYQPDANGKAQLWFDADAAGINVTFTGEHTVQDVTVDGVARKLYTLTGDGVLTVSGAVSFFMIGGGSSGEHAGIGGYGGFCSGRGGCGGKVVSGVLTANEPVTVTIGKGGAKAENSGYNAGTATTLSGVLMPTYTADGGTILAGGTGGGAGADCSSAGQFSVAGGSGAGVSTMPFGLADLGKPGGGGGGGAVYSTNYGRYSGGNGGTDGGNGSNGVKGNYTPGSGGADGGGKGGSNGSDGSDATGKGSGGGGGAAYYPGSDARYGKGGAGADGAVWLLV